jgi:hypothetical protein
MLPSTTSKDSMRGMLVFGMLESQRKVIHRFKGEMFDLRRTGFEVKLKGEERVVVDVVVFLALANRGVRGLDDRR